MAYSLNRAQLIGNLGQDPEVRYTPSGAAVCTLSIATTESYKDKQSGEWKETTEWHRVNVWNRLAETAGQYLKKGSKVFIEGKIQTRSYQDNQGQTKYMTEILGLQMIMLTPRPGQGGGQGGGFQGNQGFAPSQGNQGFAPQGGGQQQQQQQGNMPQDNFGPDNFGGDFSDDEVPF